MMINYKIHDFLMESLYEETDLAMKRASKEPKEDNGPSA